LEDYRTKVISCLYFLKSFYYSQYEITIKQMIK
jgi:hypothetical protein